MSTIPSLPLLFMCHLLIALPFVKIQSEPFYENVSFRYIFKGFMGCFARDSFVHKRFACLVFCIFSPKLYKSTKKRQRFFFMFPKRKIHSLMNFYFVNKKYFIILQIPASLFLKFSNVFYRLYKINKKETLSFGTKSLDFIYSASARKAARMSLFIQ